MSKLDGLLEKCEAQLKATGVNASNELLRAVTKGLGPSVYNRDGLLVAARDKSELDRIRKNFIEKKKSSICFRKLSPFLFLFKILKLTIKYPMGAYTMSCIDLFKNQK